jgi:hypothetical protein
MPILDTRTQNCALDLADTRAQSQTRAHDESAWTQKAQLFYVSIYKDSTMPIQSNTRSLNCALNGGTVNTSQIFK